MDTTSTQKQENDNAARCASAHPEFDGTNVSCGVYEEVFLAATFGGNPLKVEDYLASKAMEVSSVLRLLSGKDTPKLNDFTSHLLVMLISALVLNIDLERAKAAIKPCGSPGCKCHETKHTVVHSLQLIKGYLQSVAAKEDSGLGFATAQ